MKSSQENDTNTQYHKIYKDLFTRRMECVDPFQTPSLYSIAQLFMRETRKHLCKSYNEEVVE